MLRAQLSFLTVALHPFKCRALETACMLFVNLVVVVLEQEETIRGGLNNLCAISPGRKTYPPPDWFSPLPTPSL